MLSQHHQTMAAASGLDLDSTMSLPTMSSLLSATSQPHILHSNFPWIKASLISFLTNIDLLYMPRATPELLCTLLVSDFSPFTNTLLNSVWLYLCSLCHQIKSEKVVWRMELWDMDNKIRRILETLIRFAKYVIVHSCHPSELMDSDTEPRYSHSQDQPHQIYSEKAFQSLWTVIRQVKIESWLEDTLSQHCQSVGGLLDYYCDIYQ